MIRTLIAALLSFTLLSSSSAIAKETIKVGALLSLSGEFAPLGNEIVRGLKLGLQNFSDDQYKIELHIQDIDTMIPRKAVKAANYLLHQVDIDIGFAMIIDEARAIGPMFSSHQTPLVVLWDSNKTIFDSGEYVFSNGFSTEKAGQQLAEQAFLRDNIETMAILSHENPWSLLITESFIQHYTKLGGQITQQSKYFMEEQHYQATLAKIKNSQARGIFLPLLPPTLLNCIQQIRALQIDMSLYTGDALTDDIIESSNNVTAEITLVTPHSSNQTTLEKMYLKKFATPIKSAAYVEMGYDGIQLLKQLLPFKHNLYIQLKSHFGKSRTANKSEKLFKIYCPQNLNCKKKEILLQPLAEIKN